MNIKIHDTGIEVIFTCTEREARVLVHIMSYLSGKKWREVYSHEHSEENLNAVIHSIRGKLELIIRAIDAGRKTMMEKLQ